MKKTLLSNIALMAIAGSASAADLPSIKSAPTPAPAPMWTGFYAGLNAGGTWSNSNSINFSTYPSFSSSAYPAFSSNTVKSAMALNQFVPSNSGLGFIGGGQLGYNYQIKNNFVMGIEVDIQGIANSADQPLNIFSAVNASYIDSLGNNTENSLYQTFNASKNLNYIGTARGRIGYLLMPNVAIYGTGGLAYGGVDLEAFGWQRHTTVRTDEIGPGKSSASRTLAGWSAGGGIEWMLMSNWSVKAEYLYYNLGTIQMNAGSTIRTWSGAVSRPLVSTGEIVGSTTSQATAKFYGNIVRLGVNYHFNFASTPAVAKF